MNPKNWKTEEQQPPPLPDPEPQPGPKPEPPAHYSPQAKAGYGTVFDGQRETDAARVVPPYTGGPKTLDQRVAALEAAIAGFVKPV